MATVVASLLTGHALSQDAIPPGITAPTALPPFDEGQPACAAPTGRQKSLTFVQDNRRAFIEGVGHGLAMAASNRALAYDDVVANDDPRLMIEQVAAAHLGGAGGIVIAPVDPRSLAPSLQAAIADGVYVGAVVPPPAVTILNAPQYLTDLDLSPRGMVSSIPNTESETCIRRRCSL